MCSADHARHGVRGLSPRTVGQAARRLRPHGNPTIGERNSSDDRPGDDRGLEGDMAPESRRDRTLAGEEITSRIASFPGELHDVTDARLVAEEFLFDLARASAPSAPEHWDDILLVVTELAANAVQYAPGPFELRLRRTFDGCMW